MDTAQEQEVVLVLAQLQVGVQTLLCFMVP